MLFSVVVDLIALNRIREITMANIYYLVVIGLLVMIYLRIGRDRRA